jgi:flagellar basal body-associated protein FliL
MKTKNSLFILILIVIFLIPVAGCKVVQPHRQSKSVIFRSNQSGKIPPGQLKKATGAKSAKEYAPGQNKKKKKNK